MKRLQSPKKYVRLLVGIGIPVAALGMALLFFVTGKTPPCIFYDLTGLYCVGCGTGRAMLALLHGHIYAAFRYQPLLVSISPFLTYFLLKYYLAFVLGKDILPFPEISNRWFGITAVIVVIAYWILRNIPIVPFSYLAPTAV